MNLHFYVRRYGKHYNNVFITIIPNYNNNEIKVYNNGILGSYERQSTETADSMILSKNRLYIYI